MAIDISYSFSLSMLNVGVTLSLCFIGNFKTINMIIQSKNFIEAAALSTGCFFNLFLVTTRFYPTLQR